LPTDTRRTSQTARRLEQRTIEGFECLVSGRAALEKGGYKELVETRAIARELIGHINALEFEQAERMGVDDVGNSTTHPNRP
jgi:hypothetical protein